MIRQKAAVSGVVLIVMGVLIFTGEMTELNVEAQRFLQTLEQTLSLQPDHAGAKGALAGLRRTSQGAAPGLSEVVGSHALLAQLGGEPSVVPLLPRAELDGGDAGRVGRPPDPDGDVSSDHDPILSGHSGRRPSGTARGL